MEEKTIEQLKREQQSQPCEFYQERQLLQEPDYKLEAMKIAATLKNSNLDELLGRYEQIYEILTEKPKKKSWVDEQIKKDLENRDRMLEKIVWDGGEHFNK